MDARKVVRPIMDLPPYGRYEGTFPRGKVREGEKLLIEWKPSKAQLIKGHPILGLLLFPGSFTIPFLILIPLLAFLGALSWVLEHRYLVGFTVAAAVLIVVYGLGAISWLRTSYAITDRAVYVRTGVVLNRVYRTPMEDIIDVKTNYSSFERIVGKGTVVFHLKKGRIRKRPKLKWHTVKHPEKIAKVISDLMEGRRVDQLDRSYYQ